MLETGSLTERGLNLMEEKSLGKGMGGDCRLM